MQWVQGALSSGVKWVGHQVDSAPSSSAHIKNEMGHTTALFICLCDVDRDSFTFTFV
jgi:hypothetical protein